MHRLAYRLCERDMTEREGRLCREDEAKGTEVQLSWLHCETQSPNACPIQNVSVHYWTFYIISTNVFISKTLLNIAFYITDEETEVLKEPA